MAPAEQDMARSQIVRSHARRASATGRLIRATGTRAAAEDKGSCLSALRQTLGVYITHHILILIRSQGQQEQMLLRLRRTSWQLRNNLFVDCLRPTSR